MYLDYALDLAFVLRDIKRVAFSPEYGGVVILFGLELIKSYDISSREEFLDAAFDIYSWLQQEEPENLIYKLNELQITRRQRTYSKDEKTLLLEEKTKNANDNRVLCAINILLENKSEAEFNFDKLTEAEKKEFVEYPIFTLAKQLGMFQNEILC
jgi:hypothetical protein